MESALTFGMFRHMSTVPSSPPKPGHTAPVFALSAMRHASTVGKNSRRAHLPARGSGSDGNGAPVMVGHAATSQMLCMDWIRLLDLRIKSPPLRARLGIECNDDVVGFAEIEFVAYLQRRDLVSCLARVSFAADIDGMIGPKGLEIGDIAGSNLVKRRIAAAMRRSFVRMPLAGRHAGACNGSRGDLGPGGLPLMSCDATEAAKPAVPR